MGRVTFRREKGQKYRNTKCEFAGIKFDSKREMQRYIVLKEAQDKGLISDLQCQVKFELIPPIIESEVVHLKTKDKVVKRTIQQAITYRSDFIYTKEGQLVVEDCKISPHLIPKEYALKEKLFRWRYGFSIRRVYKANEEI